MGSSLHVGRDLPRWRYWNKPQSSNWWGLFATKREKTISRIRYWLTDSEKKKNESCRPIYPGLCSMLPIEVWMIPVLQNDSVHMGTTAVQWLTLLPYSKDILGLVSSQGHVLRALACGFSLGAPASFHSPNTCNWNGWSKLPIDVNVSVYGFLSRYFSPGDLSRVSQWHCT